MCQCHNFSKYLFREVFIIFIILNILPPYRKAHVSELFDETVHDPGLIWLVAHLPLSTHKQVKKLILPTI